MAIYLRPFKQNTSNWRFLIRKKKTLFNLADHQDDEIIYKIYLYAKDASEAKYQLSAKKQRSLSNIDNCNPGKWTWSINNLCLNVW